MTNDKLMMDGRKPLFRRVHTKSTSTAIKHTTTISLTGKNESPKLPTLENSNPLDSTRTNGVVAMPLHPLIQQDCEPRSAVFSDKGKTELSTNSTINKINAKNKTQNCDG